MPHFTPITPFSVHTNFGQALSKAIALFQCVGLGLLVLVSSTGAIAQTTGWVSGYVVTQAGDTLRGQLNNRDWANTTPDQVAFRQSAQTATTTYMAPQLLAFYFQPSNERYIRLTAPLDKTPRQMSSLQTSDQVVWVDETVFAQQVVGGLLSLAMHRDKAGKTHYLVQRQSEPWQDLVLLKYLPQPGQLVTVERYRQQLGTLTFDCPTLKSRLTNLAFSQSALQAFVGAYNICQTGQAGSYQQPSVKSTLDWGLLAGASTTQLAIRIPASPDYFTDQPYPYTGSVQPSAGVWLNYYMSRRRQQWSVYNDLHYQRFDVSGSWSGNARQLSGQFAYAYVKLHTAVRWQLPRPSGVKPFAMLGISNGFAIAHAQTLRADENRTYEQALFGSVGLRAGRLMGEIRYERGNGMSTDNGLITGTQTAFFLLSLAL